MAIKWLLTNLRLGNPSFLDMACWIRLFLDMCGGFVVFGHVLDVDKNETKYLTKLVSTIHIQSCQLNQDFDTLTCSFAILQVDLCQDARRSPVGWANHKVRSATCIKFPNLHQISQLPNAQTRKKTENAEMVEIRYKAACVSCTAQHIRCDGRKPACGRCKKTATACVFEPMLPRGGNTAGRIKRKRELEAHLAKLRGEEPPVYPDPSPHDEPPQKRLKPPLNPPEFSSAYFYLADFDFRTLQRPEFSEGDGQVFARQGNGQVFAERRGLANGELFAEARGLANGEAERRGLANGEAERRGLANGEAERRGLANGEAERHALANGEWNAELVDEAADEASLDPGEVFDEFAHPGEAGESVEAKVTIDGAEQHTDEQPWQPLQP